METHIAILNGNGIHNLPTPPGRGSIWKDIVVAINNFSNFGVDRTVIYYRPETERVATSLNKKFFPGRNLSRRPGWLTVSSQGSPGPRSGPNNRPKPRRLMGRISGPEPARDCPIKPVSD